MDIDEEVLPAIEESDEQPAAPNVFIPGTHTLGQDEILEPDDSVYIMRHSMKVNWPGLSFDVLRDSLGEQRQRYPATAYLVTGTQADVAKNNELLVYKLSSLHRTQKDGGECVLAFRWLHRKSNLFPQMIPTLKPRTTRTMTTLMRMLYWNIAPFPISVV
jgi:hypothetical protein